MGVRMIMESAVKNGEFEFGAVMAACLLQAGLTVRAIGHNPAAKKRRIHLKLRGNVAKAITAIEKGLDSRQLELL